MTSKPVQLLTFLFLAIFFLAPAAFATTADPSWKFNRSFSNWTSELNAIETRFDDPDHITENAQVYRTKLLEIRLSANNARDQANEFATATQDLLNALGARPADDEPEEAANVAEKRQRLEAEIADFRGRAAQSQLIVRRVDTLMAGLTAIEQGQAVRTLLTRNPSPLAPSTLAEAPVAAWVYIVDIGTTPITWWQDATTDEREKLTAPIILFSTLLLVIGALGSRRVLIRWVGRDESIEAPSYTRRLLGASTEALANGMLPALLAAVLWLSTNRALDLEPGAALNLVNGLVASSLIIIAALSLPRAALSPALPNWRVAPIKPEYARRLTSRIGALGTLFGIEVFISFTSANASPAFLSVYSVVITSLEAILILGLLRPALWQADPDWQPGQHHFTAATIKTEESHQKGGLAWQALRFTIAVIVLAGTLAAWIGYTALANYLFAGLITSALIVGALFLLRALFEEWANILMARNQVVDWLNLSEAGRATVQFWLIGLLEVLVYISGAALIGAAWGVPLKDIWTLIYNLLTSISVGGVTISIADIVEAIIVFAVTLILFRLGKQLLRNTILPQTRMDAGAQYSIAAIFGYVGIVTAVILSATALGIDFQNLIIIAGALSVGIGFGLQNIANNFISGLILLFERPIKVGDLIEIGDTLGHVTHINVRRTEVETFQRAEVMIPNSELVATSVINWTHSDRNARVEINVGVAYGSNTELVRATLLKAAAKVDRIVNWPMPDVLFLDFGDSSLNFQLRCFTSDVSSRISTASALRFEIDRLFREAGIEIPFPQRVLHMASSPQDDNQGKSE